MVVKDNLNMMKQYQFSVADVVGLQNAFEIPVCA